MEFDWNDEKQAMNLVKHGIDFHALLPCFSDPDRLEWQDERQNYGEVRINMFVKLNGRLLHITYTVRDSVYWIISARKANEREQVKYGRQTNG